MKWRTRPSVAHIHLVSAQVQKEGMLSFSSKTVYTGDHRELCCQWITGERYDKLKTQQQISLQLDHLSGWGLSVRFKWRTPRDCYLAELTEDLNIGTLVGTLPDTWKYNSKVPDQNGVSQAWYIVEIHHSGRKLNMVLGLVGLVSLYCNWTRLQGRCVWVVIWELVVVVIRFVSYYSSTSTISTQDALPWCDSRFATSSFIV